MVESTLTRTEVRHALREDPILVWFRDAIIEKFEHRKNLIGAQNTERLWQIKGHSEILQYLENPDLIIGLLDEEDDI